ncbi:macro domain-containing protein [Candidatus Desantisbacteria bacterium]|nr:macro domain-containing protein [Candidatus Desantisbacteria bacterium]
MDVEAIVNAANTDLILGGGVAGAILRKGGIIIQKECDNIGRIPLGEAVITTGGSLKAKYVIHAAGMNLGDSVSEKSLKDTTHNSLLRAKEAKFTSIAFPAIGTGIGGFPVKDCAVIMLDEIVSFFSNIDSSLNKIYFVLYDKSIYDEFYSVFSGKKIHFIEMEKK